MPHPAPRLAAPADDVEHELEALERSVRVKTAAQILDADESHVRELLREGKLRGHRWGKRGVRIYLSSIDDYRSGRPLGGKATPAPGSQTRKRDRQKPLPAHAEAVAHLKRLGLM